MLRRFCLCLLALTLLLPAGAFAEAQAPRVEETKLVIGENSVRYPQLAGLKDEAVQKKINDDIVLSGDITAHILTLSGLGQSQWGLKVDYQAYIDSAVLSVVISAEGKQTNGRNGQSNTALSYDLSTGDRVTLDQLFTRPAETVAAMEAIAADSLLSEMTEYMEAASLTPLPENSFYLDQVGVTFYYPTRQFSYLSGYGGACQFTYDEISEWLITDQNGLLARMNVLPPSYTQKEQAALVAKAVTDGRLPGVPAALGDAMTDIVDRYRLVRTPDAFPGGRYFVLEAPAFRGVLLISDDMESGYEHSCLKGVQLKRGSLYGLKIGEAQRDDWLKALGQPEETMTFTQNMAYDYNLPVGQSDIYRFGEHELRLHADESGVLRCVQLGQ